MTLVSKYPYESLIPGPGRPPTMHRKALEESEKARNTLPESIRPEIKAMSPLSVMLYSMWIYANRDNWDKASYYAAQAAPYVHPKLASTTINATVRRSADEFDDTELVTIAGTIYESTDPESLFADSGGAGSEERAAEAEIRED